MKRLVFSILLLTIIFALPSFAENTTVMNVHVARPVAIPGKVLLPGDYIFRLDDSGSGQRTVAIFSADSNTVYGFFPAYTTYRDSADASEIRATKSVAGLSLIDSWFFPGQQQGYRFIYSKENLRKAATLAEQVRTKSTQAGF